MSSTRTRQDAALPTSLHPIASRHARAFAFLVTALLAASPAAADPMPGWAWMRPVTVDNTGQASPLVGYPLHVTLQSPAFDFAQARSDGADIRFTNQQGTLLPYWIETWNPGGGTASLWVKADSLPAGQATTLYLLHGNPAAAPAADPHATFLFYDGFESKNAPGPLTTPTYDGTGQAMHPSVVYVPGGWNGYEYWMGMTPYSFDQDSHENPSVIASHDGLTWVVPAGLANPLAGPFSGGYNDDTELLLVNNKLVLYYLQTFNSGTTNFRRMESSNGTSWTSPTTVMSLPNYPVSPTIVIEGGVWKMWYVNSTGGCYSSVQSLYLRTSSDGIAWSAPTLNTLVGASVVPWHPEVRKDGSKYVMLVASYDPATSCEHCDLYYAESTDGLTWTFAPRPIIARTGGGWDNLEIYRTSFLVSGGFMRVWYSASSTAHVWGTAYVEGTLQDFLVATASPWDDARGNMENVTSPVRSGQYSLDQSGGSTYPRLAKDFAGKFAVTTWLYDAADAVSEHAAVLRLWDPGTQAQPLHAIGVGFATEQSTSNYAYHTEAWNYSTTSVARTVGWHRLTAAIASSTCRLLVDDTNVANLNVLDENAINQFSIEGDVGGDSWFDDVYVRPYLEPEPAITVQDAIGTTGVAGDPGLGALGLRVQAVRPNPAPGHATIAFSLARPGQVSVRLLGVQGAAVRTLADGNLPAGPHTLAWDGDDDRGRRAPSGVYFLQVVTPGASAVRRIVVLR